MIAARHGRTTTAPAWVGILAVTFAVHAVAVIAVYGLDLIPDFSPIPEADAAAMHAAAVPDVELSPTCTGDALLAMSARAAMCLAPWREDQDDCLYDARMSMYLDVSTCQARNEPAATTIGLVEQKQIEKVKPIDAERLMDEFEQAKKEPPKPLPKPEPQQQVQAQRPPPPPPQQRPMQVVENVKPNTDEEPDNARLLAEYNTKVEKQHVNRGARNEPMVAKAKPEELTPKKDPTPEPSVKQNDPDRDPGKDRRAPDAVGNLSMRHPGLPHPAQAEQEQKIKGDQRGTNEVAQNDGVRQRKGDGSVEQQHRDRGEQPKGDGGAGGGQPPVPNLRPTQEQLERVVGGGSVDHLDDVDNGDETALNAKRWVYASFFNRMKRQVAQNWDPQTVWRRVDPTGTVWGNKTRVTEVRVSLGAKGDVQKIVVVGPSGVTDLDDEGVRAFKAAGPFVNPPEGLVNQKDGLITFAFSFYFEIGGGHTSWRVIRSI